MSRRAALPAVRRVRLHHIPLMVATRAVPLVGKTCGLAVLQAVMGTSRRWRLVQILIAAAAAGTPGISFLRPFAAPLLCSWVYGLAARLFAPAHARSLKFWKKVVPIYLGYKTTQATLTVQNASPQRRMKTWNKRHEWGAEKVRRWSVLCELILSSCSTPRERSALCWNWF